MNYDTIMQIMFQLIIALVALNLALIITVRIAQRLMKCQVCGRRGVRQVTLWPGTYGLRCRHCGEMQVLTGGGNYVQH